MSHRDFSTSSPGALFPGFGGGHRSLIKNETQTAVINIVSFRILIYLTFRMLALFNIHFQSDL